MPYITLVGTKDLSREEWLKYRMTGIGGSDAGAVLGLDPFNSRLSCYLDKLGLLPEKPMNEAMRQGKDAEPMVAARFTEQTGKKVRRKNALLQSEQWPWMIADVDFMVVGENAGLECKTTNYTRNALYQKNMIPPWHYAQVMHYLAVTGLDRWYVAVLVWQTDFHVLTVERNESDIAALVEAERKFWYENVLAKVEPLPSGDDASADAIGAMYPEAAVGTKADLTGLETEAEEYLRYKALAAEYEAKAELIKQNIQVSMGNAEVATMHGYQVTWGNVSSNRLDTKQFRRDYPALYEQYSKPSVTRRFSIEKEA